MRKVLKRVEVVAPDPRRQHEKTPLYILEWREIRDELTGEVHRVPRRRLRMIGNGEEARVATWKWLIEETLKRNPDPDGFKKFLEHARKQGRWGLGCPHGCGRF